MLILASILSGLPSGGQHARARQHGRHDQAMPFLLAFLVLGDGHRRLHGARAAAHRGQLREAAAGPPHVRGPDEPLAVQDQHVGRDPADLRLELDPVPGDDRELVRHERRSVSWLQRVAAVLSPGQPVYILLYAGLIMFFCFFYTALVFNSRETAENLRKSGAFIPGIRPGQQTADYIDKVLTRLTFWGALYITAVCLIPEFLILEFSVPFYFGGTSLLIIVVVTMDFMAQLQAHMMTHQYEGLLKKANLRGYGKADK